MSTHKRDHPGFIVIATALAWLSCSELGGVRADNPPPRAVGHQDVDVAMVWQRAGA